jgi:transposase
LPLLQNKTNVYCYCVPIDMRKSFDSICSIVKNELNKNIFEDSLFLFVNKFRDKAKVLYWDGTGLVIFYKRLEKGQFCNFKRRTSKEVKLSFNELQLFLEGTKLEKELPLSPEPLDTSAYA